MPMRGELAERPPKKARKLLRRLKDAARLDHAEVYMPGSGNVMIELPKGGKR